MGLFIPCKHDWVVKIDKFIPSFMERMKELGTDLDYYDLCPRETKGKHIMVMTCVECGDVRKEITEV